MVWKSCFTEPVITVRNSSLFLVTGQPTYHVEGQPSRRVCMCLFHECVCVCVSTLLEGRRVTPVSEGYLHTRRGFSEQIVAPGNSQTVPVWQSIATSRSRIYRSAMWIQVHWVWLSLQDAPPLPPQSCPDPFCAAEQIASCCRPKLTTRSMSGFYKWDMGAFILRI